MTEKEFVKRNKAKWLELEELLKKNKKDADQLHDLFIKVSSDLSYARTFFPNRSVRQYLNNLTNQVFNSISKDKRSFRFGDIIHFYRHTLPREVYRNRRAFIVSLLIFIVAFSIGVLSTIHNEEFLSYIIGEEYVQMTEQNINEGDPMKVYKDKDKIEMFMGITINNIRVAFNAFVLGLLGTIGTVYILMYNGIMVGAFQYFFVSKGLFWTSFLTIWVHGTIEISAIIIAGAAGIILGNGLLFPKTHHRTSALQISAQRALTVLLGTVPLFVIAGLLEGFVTRLTDLPSFVKAGIILISLVFVLLIFVVYPYLYMRSLSEEERNQDEDIIPVSEEMFYNTKYMLRSTGQALAYAFARYRNTLIPYIGKFALPATLFFGLFSWVYIKISYGRNGEVPSLFSLSEGQFHFPLYILISLIIAGALLHIIDKDEPISDQSRTMRTLISIKKYFPSLLLISLGFYAPIYFLSWRYILLAYFFIPPQFLVFLFETVANGDSVTVENIVNGYGRAWQQYTSFIIPFLICCLIVLVYQVAIYSGAISSVTGFIKWHYFFEESWLNAFWIDGVIELLFALILFPLLLFIICAQYYSEICKVESIDLMNQAVEFGRKSDVFESDKVISI